MTVVYNSNILTPLVRESNLNRLSGLRWQLLGFRLKKKWLKMLNKYKKNILKRPKQNKSLCICKCYLFNVFILLNIRTSL